MTDEEINTLSKLEAEALATTCRTHEWNLAWPKLEACLLDNCKELLRAAKAEKKLRSILARAVKSLEEHIAAIGGCEHDIGMCGCEDISIVEDGKAALKAASEIV